MGDARMAGGFLPPRQLVFQIVLEVVERGRLCDGVLPVPIVVESVACLLCRAALVPALPFAGQMAHAPALLQQAGSDVAVFENMPYGEAQPVEEAPPAYLVA